MTRIALDARLKVALVTLGAIALAMVARPAHAQEYPQAAAEAVCQAYAQTAPEDRPAFWKWVDSELKLTDRQRVELRLFCLGYQRGLLSAARLQDGQQ